MAVWRRMLSVVARAAALLYLSISVHAANNSPPFIVGPSAVSGDEDTTITIAGLSVSDSDLGTNPIKITMSCSTGKLKLHQVLGLTFAVGSSDDSASLAFSGLIDNVNAALNGMTFATPQNFNGSDTVTMVADDQGHTGDGGAKTASKIIAMTVNAVNDPPIFTKAISDLSVGRNKTTDPLPFSASDIDAGDTLSFPPATSNNQTLIPDANIVMQINGNDGTLTITPVADMSGSATIMLTVKDAAGATAVKTFVLTVNDKPTITALADQNVLEDTSGTQTFSVADTETALANLTVGANSDTQTLVPDANMVISGATNPLTLTVTPAANQSGSAKITVTVIDPAGAQAKSTFTLTVTPVNDAPVLNLNISAHLEPILQNESDNGGTKIAIMLAGSVSDADPSAVTGIAVVASDSANGSWQYSVDDGKNWTPFVNVSVTQATLLLGTDFVRFVPGTDFRGTAVIVYHAWDTTDGKTHGTTGVDVSQNGGSTAYSIQEAQATVTVVPVNHAPVIVSISPDALPYVADHGDGIEFSANATDHDGDGLFYTWNFGDGTTANGDTLTHVYAAGGSFTATLTVFDGNGGSDSKAVTISVSRPMRVQALSARVNFSKPGSDRVVVRGDLVLPESLALGGKHLRLKVCNLENDCSIDSDSGVERSFSVDGKLKATAEDAPAGEGAALALALNARKLSLKFSLTLKNGVFASGLSLANKSVKKDSVRFCVRLISEDGEGNVEASYQRSMDQLYSAVQDRSGRTSPKR